MHVADALSQTYFKVIEDHDSEEMEFAVHTLTANLPLSDSKKAKFTSTAESGVSLQHTRFSSEETHK